MSTRSPGFRRAYIDWARGIAVLLMIEAHTIDAWTRLADRHSRAFRRGRHARRVRGAAVPVAGRRRRGAVGHAALRFDAGSREQRSMRSCRRGLEIFILAFLFRLQAFIVSPGQPSASRCSAWTS